MITRCAFLTRLLFSFFLSALFVLNACSTIRIHTLPAPPPSAKLRVLVMALSEDPVLKGAKWNATKEEFDQNMSHFAGILLKSAGIYEVVPRAELEAALGGQKTVHEAYWWVRDNYALVRKLGKAVHAEYGVFICRTLVTAPEYKMIILNMDTAAAFETSFNFHLRTPIPEARVHIATMYQRLFMEAKHDLLKTAVRKGRLMPVKAERPELAVSTEPVERKGPVPGPVSEPLKPAPAPKAPRLTPPSASATAQVESDKIAKGPGPQPSAEQKESISIPAGKPLKSAPVPTLSTPTLPSPPIKARVDLDKIRPTPREKDRLVVYDFTTSENLHVVSLILTEALREELFQIGRHLLISRDNMVQIMQELQLQKSGVVDEAQMLKLGKWFAANEAVTGRLGIMGKTYILQVRRTDIQTMNTLGLGSAKCETGDEEKLLSSIPALARKIMGLKEGQ